MDAASGPGAAVSGPAKSPCAVSQTMSIPNSFSTYSTSFLPGLASSKMQTDDCFGPTKLRYSSSWPTAARGSKRGAAQDALPKDRLEDSVRFPDVFVPPPAGDEREDLFGLLARHRGRLVGPHIRQLTH